MHITVYCPRCGTKVRLNPEMKGQRMRCTNAICREVFEVRPEEEPTEPPPEVSNEEADAKSTRRTAAPAEVNFVSGSVGQMVPLLSVEAAEETPATAEPPPEPTWQKGPPPVRRSASVGEMVPLLPTEPAAEVKPPEEEKVWDLMPPPVRRAKPPEPPPAPAPEPPAIEPPSWQQAPPPVRQPAASAAPPVPVEPPAPKPKPRRKPAETMPALKRPEPATESTAPPPPVAAPDAPKELPPGSWEPPPVRRPVAETPPPPEPAPTPEAPKEMPAGSWEPPPVRRPVAETPPSEEQQPAVADEPAPSPPVSEEHPVPARGRSAVWVIAGMAALVLVGMLGVGAVVVLKGGATEEEAGKQAKQAYDDGNYPDAARQYQQLRKRFPESPSVRDYEFWEDLSQVRSQIKAVDVSGETALEQLRAFLRKHQNHPLLHQFDADILQAYVQLLDGKLVPSPTPKVTPENFEDEARKLLAVREVEKEAEPFGKVGENLEREGRLLKWQAAILREQNAKEFLARRDLDAKDINPQKLRRLEKDAEDKGIREHKLVREKLDWIAAQLPLSEVLPGGPKLLPPPADTARTMLVVPRLDAADRPVPAPPKAVVFAVARGVLYALRADDGQVLWADRVGIDTATLPLRLPRSEANPRELVLVLSSDNNTLTACDVLTGEKQWQYSLGQPCLGRPVLVGRKAFVATVDRHIHEIEIVKGEVLGRYKVDEDLTGFGAHEAGTSLVYFPAVAGFVYVFDVEKRKCVAVMQTGHPSGSLRMEPVLFGGEPAGLAPRFLILTQTTGLDAMKLLAFRLPVTGIARTPPEPPIQQVRGWSWFPPYCDGEKLVVATDAGVLGMFGINQVKNYDTPLFPLLPRECKLEGDDKVRGRALVVHAAENDFWVLAQGQMQHYRLGLSATKGLHVAPVWGQPLALGSPLHAGQASDNQDTLYVVTQEPERQLCVATAVDAATGRVRWRRQLGLNCQGDPLLLGGRVLTGEQGGGLLVFDPKDKGPLARPTEEKMPARAVWSLPAADGQSTWTLTVPAPGRLALRREGLNGGRAKDTWEDFPGILSGAPALGNGCLVLPLANGTLVRHALMAGAKPDAGPDWRVPHADADAVGRVTALGGSVFLVTNGSRGLWRLSWPGKAWDKSKPEDHVELEERIAAAPLALTAGDRVTRVCIADVANKLKLLDVQSLKEVRRWSLTGKVTNGPFLLGTRIGCVLDRRRLVCFDPERDAPLWEQAIEEGEGIVGRPQKVGDAVVVADISGRFVALDAETGKPRGPGYMLKASAAPAAAPVAFGEGQVFAPLTDGTVLLLTLEQMTKP